MVVVEIEAEEATVVAEEEAVNHSSSRVQAPLQPPPPVTEVQNILIFRQASGKDAPCIISSGNKVTSVLSQQHAPGKMCSSPDQTNETGTSPLIVN